MRALLAFIPLLAACGSPPAASWTGFVNAPTSSVAAVVPGQVLSVEVSEGDRVTKGQVLAKLDSREREAMVAEAQANVERAREGLNEAQESMRATVPTVRGAGADITRAQASLDAAQRNHDRVQQLADGGGATAAQLDEADARLAEAKATLQSLVAGKDVASGRVRTANAAVANAQANVRSVEAALDLARTRLAECLVLAPFDGVVVERDLEPGDWAAPGSPVVTVEDDSRLWVRVDVGETQLGTLKLGDSVDIVVVAMPERTIQGTISEIGAEGDFALNRDVKRGRADIRTFRVRAHVEGPVEGLRPGMTAEIRLRDGK